MFGLKNKKEIWKAETVIRGFRSRARRLFTEDTGKEELFSKLKKLGIFRGDITLDDVLGLKIENILERRLQTIVLRKGFAQTPQQARQLIVHRHITIGGQIVNIPGYIVTVSEEEIVEYSKTSPLDNKEHPLRAKPEGEKIEIIEEETKYDSKEGPKQEKVKLEVIKEEPAAKEKAEPVAEKETAPKTDDASKEEKTPQAEKTSEKKEKVDENVKKG